MIGDDPLKMARQPRAGARVTTGLGAPPKSGWAKLVPGLLVSDIGTSLEFWCDWLGFAIAHPQDVDNYNSVFLSKARRGT